MSQKFDDKNEASFHFFNNAHLMRPFLDSEIIQTICRLELDDDKIVLKTFFYIQLRAAFCASTGISI